MNTMMKEEVPLEQSGIPMRMASVHPMWTASRQPCRTQDMTEGADADRRRLAEAVARLRRQADEQGGDGFLLGHDPRNPRMHVRSNELALGVDSVFVWDRSIGEAPGVEWRDVASISTSDFSIEMLLVDGRTIFLHADIDWSQRPS